MTWRFRVPRVPRASRRVLWWGGGALLVMVAWMTAPLVLRRLAFFRVRQVEFVGIRYLGAEEVLRALRLAPRASVFDDTQALAERVRRLDGVADATVLRRLPGSLKVIVREIEPVALVANERGALRIVAADGRPLPFDPAAQAASGVDLPIVQTEDSAVVGVLARIQLFDPVLFQSIDVARRTKEAQGDVILELRGGGGSGGGSHRVLLTRDAGPEVIEAVALALKDLAARARPFAELDARFAGQVVVRRHV